MLTCTKCKQDIINGQPMRTFNRPFPGAPFHVACPAPVNGNGHAAVAIATPLPVNAGVNPVNAPVNPEALAEQILAILGPRLAAKATVQCPPSAPPSAPSAPVVAEDEGDEADPCTYAQELVLDGYEPLGFDCAGFDWLPTPGYRATLEGREGTLCNAVRFHEHADALVAQPHATRNVEYWAPLLSVAMHGSTPQDGRRLIKYWGGLKDGMDLAREVIYATAPAQPGDVPPLAVPAPEPGAEDKPGPILDSNETLARLVATLTRRKPTVAQYRADARDLPLTVLVDDDEAAVAIDREHVNALASAWPVRSDPRYVKPCACEYDEAGKTVTARSPQCPEGQPHSVGNDDAVRDLLMGDLIERLTAERAAYAARTAKETK